MNLLKRPAWLVAAAAALSLAAAAPALAASDSTQFAVTAGTLAFSTAPAIGTSAFGAVTLNGTAQTDTAAMPNWQVVDPTGSGSGWNVSTQGDASALHSAVFKEWCTTGTCGATSAGTYATGGKTLAANSLTLSSTGAGFTAVSGTTGTAPTHSCASACNVDTASAVKIASAATNAGMGTYLTNGYGASSLSIAIPTTTKTLLANEVYHLDLVWSLTSGP
jgi:hypothetical protein